ncbi:MAG: protein kinase [Planctomycetota bacterium]
MISCPPRDTLMSYEQGELDGEPVASLEKHLRSCLACQEVLRQVRLTDPDTVLLRRVFESTGTRTVTSPINDSPPSLTQADDRMGVRSRREDSSPPVRSRLADAVRSLGAPVDDGTWVIPDYERVMLCGEGSYGSVWAVRDRVGVYKAMKVIDLERLSAARIQCHERSALEAYCRRIDRHPHLITVFHVGMSDRFLYYTMELADDRTARVAVRESLPRNYSPLTLDTVVRGGRLRPDVAIEVARRLLRGLDKLHTYDLLHHDIKPSNIIFVDRNPKLADIGILTAGAQTGRPVGTPRYMPPDGAVDKTADIYALGTVLREMLLGYDAARSGEPMDFRDLDSFAWEMARVGQVIARACAPSAEERYASAAAMLEDLEASRQLTGGSLLEEIELAVVPAPRSQWTIAAQIALAFIHRLPWLVGMVVVLYALSRLAR